MRSGSDPAIPARIGCQRGGPDLPHQQQEPCQSPGCDTGTIPRAAGVAAAQIFGNCFRRSHADTAKASSVRLNRPRVHELRTIVAASLEPPFQETIPCGSACSISRSITASTSPSWRARSKSAASSSLFVPEHTHIPTSRKTPFRGGGELPKRYSHTHDPFVALSFAAAATKKLLLGTGICLIPERDPIVTAKCVASLDRLSGGRFVFGIGGGWNVEEMENHGAQLQNPLQADARAHPGDEGDVDRGGGRLSRRDGRFRPGLVVAETGAAAAPADPSRRRERLHPAPRRRILRRLVPAPAARLGHSPRNRPPARDGRQARPRFLRAVHLGVPRAAPTPSRWPITARPASRRRCWKSPTRAATKSSRSSTNTRRC